MKTKVSVTWQQDQNTDTWEFPTREHALRFIDAVEKKYGEDVVCILKDPPEEAEVA